jgi:hypothetical protein
MDAKITVVSAAYRNASVMWGTRDVEPIEKIAFGDATIRKYVEKCPARDT